MTYLVTNHFASKCRSRRDQSGNAPTSSKRTTLHYAGALENVSGVSDDLFVLTLDTSRGPTQIYMHLDVQQKCIRFQVDTGATCNVLREDDLPEEAQILGAGKTLSYYDRNTTTTMNACRLQW